MPSQIFSLDHVFLDVVAIRHGDPAELRAEFELLIE